MVKCIYFIKQEYLILMFSTISNLDYPKTAGNYELWKHNQSNWDWRLYLYFHNLKKNLPMCILAASFVTEKFVSRSFSTHQMSTGVILGFFYSTICYRISAIPAWFLMDFPSAWVFYQEFNEPTSSRNIVASKFLIT